MTWTSEGGSAVSGFTSIDARARPDARRPPAQRSRCGGLTTAALVAVVTSAAACSSPPEPSDAGGADTGLDAGGSTADERMTALLAASSTPPALALERGHVSALTGRFATTGATRTERAAGLLAPYLDLFLGQGMDGAPAYELVRRSASLFGADADVLDRVVFDVAWHGVPVHGAQVTVVLEGDFVVMVLASVPAPPTSMPDLRPAIDAAAATTLVGAVGGAGVHPLGPPALVLVDPTQNRPGDASGLRLAWRVPRADGRWLVDARDGAILFAEGTSNDFDRMAIFEGADPTSAPELVYYDGECLAGHDCSGATTDAAAYLRQSSDYHLANFALLSYDGLGARPFAVVPDGRVETDNALFDIDELRLLFGASSVTPEVFGHEYMHAVMYFLHPLVYRDESGAINESFADLFGELVAAEAPPLALDTLVGTVREMCNPVVANAADYFITDEDVGGVHTNSGIANLAWCEVFLRERTAGRTDDQIRRALGRVAWLSLFALPLTPSFAQLRMATIQASRSTALPVDPCSYVAAWDRVGVEVGNRPDGLCSSLAIPPPPDADHDGVPDSQDGCRVDYDPVQRDLDGDGAGDVCDDDADGDSVWGNDNCPMTPNHDQLSTPSRSASPFGDACDPDRDGVETRFDDCPDVANPDQADRDGNLVGDACEPDTDLDGAPDDQDSCPFVAGAQADSDRDGIGDACDPCPSSADVVVGWTTGIPSLGIPPAPIVDDADGDGASDACDGTPFGAVVTGVAAAIGPGAYHLQIDAAADVPVFLPLDPCGGPCPEEVADDWRFSIDFGMLPPGSSASVFDELGQPVAVTDSYGPSRLEVRPERGRSYRLRFVAAAGSTTTAVDFDASNGPLAPDRRDQCRLRVEGASCYTQTGLGGRCMGGACVGTIGDAGPPSVCAGAPDGVRCLLPDGQNGTCAQGVCRGVAMDGGVDAGPGPSDAGASDAGMAGDAGASLMWTCDPPVPISDATADASMLDVSADRIGGAQVAWREPAIDLWSVVTSEYTVGGGFAPPQALGASGAAPVDIDVASSPTGGALASWVTAPFGADTSYHLYSRVRSAGGAFAPRTEITSSPRIGDATIALLSNGDGEVLFGQAPTTTASVATWRARARGAATWTAPVRIDGYGGTTMTTTSRVLALSPAGVGFALWLDLFAGGVHAAAIDGATVGLPSRIDRAPASASGMAAAVDPTGAGVVIWSQYDPATTGWNVAASVFDGTRFAAPTFLFRGGDGSVAETGDVAVDDAGRAVAVWRVESGGMYAPWVAYFDPATGWTSAHAIAVADTTLPANFDVALDASGTGFAVWRSGPVTGVPLTSSGLEGPAFTVAAGPSAAPRVAMLSDGTALVVYTESGPMSRIFATRCH